MRRVGGAVVQERRGAAVVVHRVALGRRDDIAAVAVVLRVAVLAGGAVAILAAVHASVRRIVADR